MLSDLRVIDLVERTAAGTPVPGGGSVSALAAALGAALAQMVANLTTGRPQFAAADHEMQVLAERAQGLHAALLTAMDRDAAAYTAVMAAFQLPRETAEEKQRRSEAVQAALKEAARVPLAVAEKALAVMELARTAVRSGNPNAASDGAVGALLARAALRGALLNVRINLRDIGDEAFAARMGKAAENLDAQAHAIQAAVMAAFPR